jgi:nitrogen fixation protein NifU and related proteins
MTHHRDDQATDARHDALRELYQEVIFDHNRSPRNFHLMPDATHQAEGYNPLCGDQLTVYLQIADELVQAASFMGQGCAICTASASLMTEVIKGKPVEEVEALFHDFHALLTTPATERSARDFGKLEVLAGVREFPARVKCATLPWHTLHNAINGGPDTARTE